MGLEQAAEVRRLAAALATRQTLDFEAWESLLLQAARQGGAGVLGTLLRHWQRHAPREVILCQCGQHGLSPVRRRYRQIDRENIRNRREHEIEHIQRRIGMLDFVLLNQEYQYFETEPEKASFFCDTLKVPNHFLPSKLYYARKTSLPTVRYFVDRFPMFLGTMPLPLWWGLPYIHGAEANLTEFVHHLEAYLPLFRHRRPKNFSILW